MPFFRRVDEEFEAHLTPPDVRPSDASGKSERKRYGDGEERLKVKARDLGLSDGDLVQVVLDGEVVAEVPVEDGRIRLDVTSTERPIPRVSEGDVIELRADGAVRLTGVYHPD